MEGELLDRIVFLLLVISILSFAALSFRFLF